ncbi:hypothetical protein B0H13DRAFT_2341468 [Mycena leptocephala]|nr:hypothetical protein B0H13DRAFT_2341468 [Mycena leptocephala]
MSNYPTVAAPRPLKRTASAASLWPRPSKRKCDGLERLDFGVGESSSATSLLKAAEYPRAPPSPPPSNCASTKAVFAYWTSYPSPPSTPPRRTSEFQITRDSPNNPFLGSPLSSAEEVVLKECGSLRRSPPEEQPTMVFVFRGRRRRFPNPYYNTAGTKRLSLSPEDSEFEPENSIVPKLLWPRITVSTKMGVNKNSD